MGHILAVYSVKYCDILHISDHSHDGSCRSVDKAFTPSLSFYEVNIELKEQNGLIYLLKNMKNLKAIVNFNIKQMYT